MILIIRYSLSWRRVFYGWPHPWNRGWGSSREIAGDGIAGDGSGRWLIVAYLSLEEAVGVMGINR
jgi:hypothetical protein